MEVEMKYRSVLILAGLMLCLLQLSVAQDSSSAIIIGQRVKLHSNVLNEDRALWIYYPDTTLTSSGRYPVLYLLDGPEHFHHATGIVEFLTRNGRMPDAIVIGVENTNRTRDLTPLPSDTAFKGSGGADAFLQFIREELIPYVDAHYPTAPYRILVGHSFGGLFAVHTLLTHPETFNAYIAISPPLWWGHDTLITQAEMFLKAQSQLPKFFYTTVGNEPTRMVTSVLRFQQVLESSPVEGFQWKFTLMEKENHGSIVHRTIYDGLEFIYEPWKLPRDLTLAGIEGLAKHFKAMSERYGYQIILPELVVNNLGYQYLAQNKIDVAIEVFKRNIKLYPESWNVYDSLGEGYMKKGDTKLAIEYYEKSVKMNPRNEIGLNALKKLKGK